MRQTDHKNGTPSEIGTWNKVASQLQDVPTRFGSNQISAQQESKRRLCSGG